MKNVRRGFTLVELMIVVAIVGVLAVIALIGYQKYSRSAAAGEARAMLLSIRGAEDAYRSEMLVYKDCTTDQNFSTGGNYYPRDYTLSDGKKVGWGDTGTAVGQCFQQLNVKSNGPVRFNFAVAAGPAGAGAFTAGAPPNSPSWPFTGVASADPWYVTAAVGKSSAGSAAYSVLFTSSGQSEVTVVDDTQ